VVEDNRKEGEGQGEIKEYRKQETGEGIREFRIKNWRGGL